MKGAATFGLALLSLVAAPRAAHAQSNYRDIPLGGRTATMGGVGTASGNDSAMPYLNPAGVSAVPGDVFALSAQLYTMSERKVDRFFSPDGYGNLPVTEPTQTFRSSKFASLPSSVMYMRHLSKPDAAVRSVLAMSVTTSSQQSFGMTGSARAQVPSINGGVTQTKNVEVNSSDTYIGPTYSLAVGDRLNIGLSGFVLLSSFSRTASSTQFQYVFNGARTEENLTTRSESQTGTSIVPVLGVQAKVIEGLRVGAALAVPSIALSAKGTVLDQQNAQGQGIRKRVTTFDGQAFARRPMRINVGASYERKKSFAVGSDVQVYLKRSKASGYSGTSRVVQSQTDDVTRDFAVEGEDVDHLEPVIDIAVGSEVWAFDWLAVRTGVFTNNSPTSLGSTVGDANDIKMRRLGVSLGVGLMAGSFETTMGVVAQHGTGTMNILDVTSTAANNAKGGALVVGVPITENTVSFVLSGVITSEEAKAKVDKQTDKVKPAGMPGGLP